MTTLKLEYALKICKISH